MITKPRRGVLLLMVLALLAMFAMVAVAFVVMTRTDRISAERVRTIDAVLDSPEKTLQQAFNVVVRGSPVNSTTLARTTSAITWQSLLEKIYGYETIGSLNLSATMANVTPFISSPAGSTEGQLIEFTLPTSPPDPTTLSSATIDPFHYVGCVVTMLSGVDAGLSSRIVGIDPKNFNVQILAFEGGLPPANGDQYIVNGFPYGGMGFGFNPNTGALNMSASGSNFPLALLPNAPPKNWAPTKWTPNANATGPEGIIPGGVNGDYTAADYQDPLLALAIATTSGGISVPIPSLHRSDLIAHLNASSNIMGNANILRQVMFRPNWIDHPSFTGSNPTSMFSPTLPSGQKNPNFNPTWDGVTQGQYSWDVDNDGDGIPDSVWVDLGLPVRYTSDGRAYKPLFAILCLDMDGRLNLNSHGNLAQSNSAYYQPMDMQHYQPLIQNLDVGMGTAGAPLALSTAANAEAYIASPIGSVVSKPPISLTRGQGTGTPEVNLLPLFRDQAATGTFYWNNYQAVLSGGGGTMGRYGPDAPAGLPNINTGALPGINGAGSLLTFNNAFPYSGVLGGNYWTHFPMGNNPAYDAYGSPPDPQDMGMLALDRAGRPLYISFGGQVANGPHDMDLTHHAAHAVNQAFADNPFGPAEFERILRFYDRDAATLPQRLAYLTSLTNSDTGSFLPARRAEFTTESNMVPVSSGVLPPGMRFSLSASNKWELPNMRSSHPIDILYSYITANKTGGNPQVLAPQLLPWEVLEGLKMDLNRPFGAGAISTSGALSQGGSATIPDQPGLSGEYLQQYINGSGTTALAKFSYAADGGTAATAVSMVYSGTGATPVNDSLAARQLYARHLYVMALTLSDTGALFADLQKSNTAATSADVTRLLAQWAVNVVAYRDHNSIMIPFVYDPNPFTNQGWRPNSSPATFNTPQYTVWGCKRPELLITETLAFHDRRTQDLSNESPVDPKKPGRNGAAPNPKRTKPGPTTSQDPTMQDPSYNSQYRPQGSLFVEVYNPWTITEARTTDLGPSPPTTAATALAKPFTNGGLQWSTTASWPTGGVQLNKLTPSSTVNGITLKPSPVWRLVIVDPTSQVNPQLMPTNGDELFDPDNPNIAIRPTIERVAYFVNLAGGNTNLDIPNDAQVIYGLSAGNPAAGTPAANAPPLVVPPSGYAVIGSGDTTATPSTPNRTFIGLPSGQTAGNASNPMITLNPKDLTTASVVMNTGPAANPAPAVGAPVPVVLGVDAAIVPSVSAANIINPQRLSVSEPAVGYAAIEKLCPGYTSYSLTSGEYNGGTTSLDIPVDQQRSLGNLSPSFTESFAGSPIWTWLNNNGTIPGFRIIYLQRLADPTRPWVSDTTGTNPQLWNPYRTVDAMTVDLTTFNSNSPLPSNPSVDPTMTTSNYHFEAHQRGDRNYLPNVATAGSPSEVNLWKQEPAFKGPKLTITANATWGPVAWLAAGAGWINGAVPGTTAIASVPLNQTLGYLNQSFTPPTPGGTPPKTPLGMLPGDPQYPFPWLNWSYRPFNNAYELLLVPIASSSRLLARNTFDPRRYFSYVDSATRTAVIAGGNKPQDVYDPLSLASSASSVLPYPHLLNFFESGSSSGLLQNSPSSSTQFHRIFDYVSVPSRFANSQIQIRPDLAGTATTANYFHTPFNRISRYQEPGHINLNTVTSSDVLLGAMNMYLPPLVSQSTFELNPVFWDKFVRSRGDIGGNSVTSVSNNPAQQTQQTLNNMLQINTEYPSRFMRPFRTSGGAFLTAPSANGTSNEPARETDVSLLRGDPDVPLRPLFEVDDYLMAPTSSPSGATASPDQFTASGGTSWACMDFNRNPYFRYQEIQKLGSVASTHSNVFAVWITVGYFEALPASNPGATDPNGNLIYPDGYQLGQELGSDSGDIVRHRSFFIFDRSIPVGFLRGHDLNQDKATLLKRFIE